MSKLTSLLFINIEEGSAIANLLIWSKHLLIWNNIA